MDRKLSYHDAQHEKKLEQASIQKVNEHFEVILKSIFSSISLLWVSSEAL